MRRVQIIVTLIQERTTENSISLLLYQSKLSNLEYHMCIRSFVGQSYKFWHISNVPISIKVLIRQLEIKFFNKLSNFDTL